MIEDGFILQPRSFDNSEAANFPPVTRELWFYLLRNANHKSRNGIERGQIFIRNLDEIREGLCWYVGYRKEKYSKPQITKSLRRLCEGNMIEKRKTTRGVIVTICNYCYYQDPTNYVRHTKDTAKETRGKEKGHTIHNNDKECKKEKKETNVVSSEKNKGGKYSEKFLAFWEEYPKKQGKAGAWKTWKARKLDNISEKIMKSLHDHKWCEQWTKDNGKYIPMGSSWINQERYEDEVNCTHAAPAEEFERTNTDKKLAWEK